MLPAWTPAEYDYYFYRNIFAHSGLAISAINAKDSNK
jgi:hypothetical protein